MKFCILTHALDTNYGGLLQAYALQTVIRRMGHDVVTDKGSQRYIPFYRRAALFIYHFVKHYILRSKPHDPFSFFFRFLRTERDEIDRQIRINTDRFIHTHIETIDFFEGRRIPSHSVLNQFDGLVVGSDQVWRPLYKYVPTYFLDFTKGMMIKRIAYAASFGVDHWEEYTPKMTRQCAEAAQWFDAISVREDSGVELCQNYLKVEAVHLLDPTLLLEKEDYLQIIEPGTYPLCKKVLMCYVLDKSHEKKTIIQQVATRLGLAPLEVMPIEKYSPQTKNLTNCVYPSVSAWIAGFRDAEFVVTDSFHGTVFAIIFNKPFIAISNAGRGTSRFTSLLKIFSLEYRLISSNDKITSQHLLPIDYLKVNKIKKKWQERSYQFLLTNLRSRKE